MACVPPFKRGKGCCKCCPPDSCSQVRFTFHAIKLNCSSSSSSSSSSISQVCSEVGVPTNLTATLSSPCGIVNGLVVNLTKSGSVWSGSSPIACEGCTIVSVFLSCSAGLWNVNCGPDGDLCPITTTGGGKSTTLISTSPFEVHFNINNIASFGFPVCCSPGTMTGVITP